MNYFAYGNKDISRFCKKEKKRYAAIDRIGIVMREVKNIPSFITVARIVGALSLLLITPLSITFFIIYVVCCLSDIADGYIARKMGTASKFGELLDSAADLIFTAVLFVIFIPIITWERWVIYWIGAVAFVRLLTLTIGFLKYRAFSLLHTYTNKTTGIALVCFPILFWMTGFDATAIILCGIATLSALEELAITICSYELNRNISHIFIIKKAKDNK